MKTNSCDLSYKISCGSNNMYNISVTTNKSSDNFQWFSALDDVVFTNQTSVGSSSNLNLTNQSPGSYTIQYRYNDSLECSTNFIIPKIEPDFSHSKINCGLKYTFTAQGFESSSDLSAVSWTCQGQPAFPSSGNEITYNFPSTGIYNITIKIIDKFGCTFIKSKSVDINSECKADF
ncbi:MAG: hypothetical protein IPG87_15920 [Saprospiraceae bacterium]|nr:hypothetical protein [Candidatus Vicinibacter affinis]